MRLWTFSDDRWLGWSPIGAPLLAFAAPLVASMLSWSGPLALLGLLVITTWDRVAITTTGVSWIRGVGPIPWSWRRLPPDGTFIVHDRLDDHGRPTEVAYSVAGVEHVLLTCADPERVRTLLSAANERRKNSRLPPSRGL